MVKYTWGCTFLLLLCPSFAQEAERALTVDSRAQEIELKRDQKARELTPDEPTRTESFLNALQHNSIPERVTNGIGGLRLKLGGLVTGSGFAAGPEYIRRDLLHEHLTFRTSAIGSTRKYYQFDAEADFHHLAHGLLFANLYAVHRDFPTIDYYGPGPNSAKTGRSDFMLEESSFDVRTGISPFRGFKLGALGRYLMFNIGPGRDARFVSADRIYSPAQAPGIRNQSNFFQAGPFIQYDWRDNPGGPRSGGNYLIQFSTYSDRELHISSFDRLDVEVQQYVSVFNQRRVFAVRGRTTLTDPHRGQFIPFYLQPTLGGSEDLRGFRPFRFYDNNSLVLNGEYRWEVFSGMDMSLFVDAGKVFPRWSLLNFANLETDYGFGLRFNVRNDVFLRIDTGFSREGFQVWFRFNNVF